MIVALVWFSLLGDKVARDQSAACTDRPSENRTIQKMVLALGEPCAMHDSVKLDPCIATYERLSTGAGTNDNDKCGNTATKYRNKGP